MKIGEAQQIYRDQVQAYQKQKRILSKQLQTARSRMEALPEGISQFFPRLVLFKKLLDMIFRVQPKLGVTHLNYSTREAEAKRSGVRGHVSTQ